MGVECTNPQGFLDNLFARMQEIIRGEFIRAFSYLGEQCIRKVRDRPGDASWFDQTGNLRSSIGYGVFEDGRKTIQSAFESVLKGAQGSAIGRKELDKLAGMYSDTFALVVIAGMEYADYVEAMNNKDVLATTEIWARREMSRYVIMAITRAERRINKLII